MARVVAAVDGGPFSDSGVACTGCGTPSTTWTWTMPAPLAVGPHTVAFRAIDGDGHRSVTVTRGVTVPPLPGT